MKAKYGREGQIRGGKRIVAEKRVRETKKKGSLPSLLCLSSLLLLALPSYIGEDLALHDDIEDFPAVTKVLWIRAW